jgi:hypothetical protein
MPTHSYVCMISGEMRPVWISFVLAVAASLTFLLAPVGTKVEAVPAGEDQDVGKVSHTNMLQTEGWSVAIPLSVGMVIAAIPLVARRRWRRLVRTVSAVPLGAYVLLGIFSVGLFFVPAWTAMIVAAVSSEPQTDSATS